MSEGATQESKKEHWWIFVQFLDNGWSGKAGWRKLLQFVTKSLHLHKNRLLFECRGRILAGVHMNAIQQATHKKEQTV